MRVSTWLNWLGFRCCNCDSSFKKLAVGEIAEASELRAILPLLVKGDGVEDVTFCVCSVESNELTGLMIIARLSAIRRPRKYFEKTRVDHSPSRRIFGVLSELRRSR